MWVGAIDVHDDKLLRAFWEAGRAGDTHGREHATFWAWTAAEVAFRATKNAVEQHAIAALDDGVVVGACQVILPVLDNRHIAYIEPIVPPAHRRRGIGTALLDAATELVTDRGRTTLIGEVNEPLDGNPSPGRDFMERHGFTVASAEIHRVLDLPVDPRLLDRLESDAAAHHTEYTIESWDDRVPDRHLDGFCRLQEAFHDEAPLGDLDLEPERWDEERVRQAEERTSQQGRHECVTVALAATGEMVALTQMMHVEENPQWGSQGYTLVMPDHRGHRLGLAIKVANQRRYQRRFPHVQVMHSWNAEVNGPMVAINETLGFRPVERLLEMQRRI